MTKYKINLLIGLIATVVILLIIGVKTDINIEKIQFFIQKFGFLAPIIFILIYSIFPILFMPITPLTITSGVLFGPVLGPIYTLIGATLASFFTFLVGRYLAKDWVDNYSHDKVNLVQRMLEKEGWKFVIIARITPLFPFNLQNYIFGVTRIKLGTFLFASLIGLIPGSILYSYLGYAGKEALSGRQNTITLIFSIIALLLMFGLIPVMIKKIKNTTLSEDN